MNVAELHAMLPLAIAAAGTLLVLLALAARAGYVAVFVLTLATLAAALASLAVAWPAAPQPVTSLLVVDGFALFMIALIFATAFVVALISYSHLREPDEEQGEYYFLLLCATLGSGVLAAANAFASLFVGLELLSVALFGMIAYRRKSARGTEAAIKYLILAGVSSAFLVLGMAFAYAETGSMEFRAVLEAIGRGGLVVPGLGLILVGIGFKLAVVPFHMWTPDVYDGAPAPVAGYIATVSKAAAAVVLLRLAGPAIAGRSPALAWTIGVIAAASMFAGNLLALREDNVKRILAYSSIANLGYLLVAFLARSPEAVRAVAFYLLAYFPAALGAFAAVTVLSGKDGEADALAAYRGIARTRPAVAGALTVMLLSLAGVPLTSGFIGKFIILQAGAGAGQRTLAVLLVVNTVISIFYYLRIVSTMYGLEPAAAGEPARRAPLAGLSLAALTVIAIGLGVYPGPLLRAIGLFAG